MNKNTLYITFDGLSDPLGQSQILPYLRGIAANGFRITILSCEKKERLEKEEPRILELIKDLPISWNYILYDEDGGFLSRFLYIQKLSQLATGLCKSSNIALVHCRSYLASLIGLKLKRKYGIPFIFDMRGFWADERLDGGIWTKTKPLHAFFYRYFKRKEKEFLAESEAVVSLTRAGLNELNNQYGTLEIGSKTTIIPCCTNTDLFNRERISSNLSVKGLSPNDHLLIYTGSVGTWYYTREMIDCVWEWKKQIPTIKLLILTKDQKSLTALLENYTEEQKNTIFTQSCSYDEVAGYLSLAKAAIFFIKPAYSKIASSPTKMAECWAMNLPIITNSGIGDNDLYFNTHKGGILLDQFTPSDYAAACSHYIQLLQNPVNYRNIALNYFDTGMAVEKYSTIYRSLTLKRA